MKTAALMCFLALTLYSVEGAWYRSSDPNFRGIKDLVTRPPRRAPPTQFVKPDNPNEIRHVDGTAYHIWRSVLWTSMVDLVVIETNDLGALIQRYATPNHEWRIVQTEFGMATNDACCDEGWLRFSGKVLQRARTGSYLVQVEFKDGEKTVCIHNLPKNPVDGTDLKVDSYKLVGDYEYITVLGANRRVYAFDYGKPISAGELGQIGDPFFVRNLKLPPNTRIPRLRALQTGRMIWNTKELQQYDVGILAKPTKAKLEIATNAPPITTGPSEPKPNE